jgi:hypothetical protein
VYGYAYLETRKSALHIYLLDNNVWVCYILNIGSNKVMMTNYRKYEMKNSLTNIKKLEKYLQSHKQDDVIEAAISKLVALKIGQIDNEINDLKLDLKQYEKKYNYSSGEFLNKFNNGQLSDNLDFIDWIAAYKMLQNRISDKSLLSEQL